jgi:hypothetical protein
MKILIACESSGAVRNAFRKLGHDAWSCDLLPADDGSPYHIQGDVIPHLKDGWDLMVGHPPCTDLAVSGARYFEQKRKDGRQQEAIDFFMKLANAPIPRIAIENPVGIMSTVWRKPNQIIQPWQFGHPESKSTCLWLKNLPLIKPTHVLSLPASGRWQNQTPSGQNKLGPSPDRWKIRSETYKGIAKAFADQWSNVDQIPITRVPAVTDKSRSSRSSKIHSGIQSRML